MNEISSVLFIIRKIVELINTIMAKVNKPPPSLDTFIPKTKRCENTAPKIIPKLIVIPIICVLGSKISMAVISSIIPNPILPHGSTPNAEKICTESGCAVNLK